MERRGLRISAGWTYISSNSGREEQCLNEKYQNSRWLAAMDPGVLRIPWRGWEKEEATPWNQNQLTLMIWCKENIEQNRSRERVSTTFIRTTYSVIMAACAEGLQHEWARRGTNLGLAGLPWSRALAHCLTLLSARGPTGVKALSQAVSSLPSMQAKPS